MLELDKIFVAKNKKALLEEMAMQLAKAKELIDVASVNPEAVSGAFVGLADAIGSIDSYFKEYMLLRRGEIPTPNVIGFQVFMPMRKRSICQMTLWIMRNLKQSVFLKSRGASNIALTYPRRNA